MIQNDVQRMEEDFQMMMITAKLVKMTMLLLISSHLMAFHYKDLGSFSISSVEF